MPLRFALLSLAMMLAAASSRAQPAPPPARAATPSAQPDVDDAPPEDGEAAADGDSTPETTGEDDPRAGEDDPAVGDEGSSLEDDTTPSADMDPVDARDPAQSDGARATTVDADSSHPLAPSDATGTGFPRHRFVWQNLLAGRINPLGLINRFELGWRVQLIDEPGKLYKDSQASVLLHTAVSPAFTHVGGRVEVQPLSVVRLGVTYAFMGSHGIFDFLQAYDDPNAEFDDKTLDDRADLNEVTTGHYLEPGVLLQAAFGPIAIRNETKAYFRSVSSVQDDGYFWDPALDVLFPNNRWALTNDADVLFLFDFGLTVGARYTLTHLFYDEDVDLSGPAGDNVTTHRVGPAILFKFFEDDPPTSFNAPTVGVLAQWWAAHRYRTGNAPAGGLEDRSVSPALPYLLLFFSAKGDFYPTKPAAPASE